MRRIVLVSLLSLLSLPALAEEIGSVGYRFKWLGPNDKIVIEAFDDPEVPTSAGDQQVLKALHSNYDMQSLVSSSTIWRVA